MSFSVPVVVLQKTLVKEFDVWKFWYSLIKQQNWQADALEGVVMDFFPTGDLKHLRTAYLHAGADMELIQIFRCFGNEKIQLKGDEIPYLAPSTYVSIVPNFDKVMQNLAWLSRHLVVDEFDKMLSIINDNWDGNKDEAKHYGTLTLDYVTNLQTSVQEKQVKALTKMVVAHLTEGKSLLIPLDGKVEYHDKNKYPEDKHAEATCERIQRDVGGYFAQLPFVFGTIYCDEEAISKKVPTNETATLILEQRLRGPVVLTPLPKKALANLRKEMNRPPLELKRKQPESVSTEEPKPSKPPKITKLEKPDNTAETKNQSTGDMDDDDMVMVIDAREKAELDIPLPFFCYWKDTNDNEKQLIRDVMAKKQSFKGYRDHNIFPLIADDDRTEEIWDAVDNIPKRWTKKLPDTPIKYLFTIVQE